MSAIVAAASARSWHVKILRQVGRTIGGPTGAHMLASADYHEQRLAAAGRAIADASNAAGAGRVVEEMTDPSVEWTRPAGPAHLDRRDPRHHARGRARPPGPRPERGGVGR